MGRSSKLMMGILLGTAIGMAFAPKKGSQLRKEVVDEIKKGGKGEHALKANAKLVGEDLVNTAKEVYADPAIQKKFNMGKKEAEKLFKKAHSAIQENGDEWVELAKEKLMEAGDLIKKSATDLTHRPKSSKSTNSESEKKSTKSKN